MSETKRVRIIDIAEELGVSTATVSNAIHGKTRQPAGGHLRTKMFWIFLLLMICAGPMFFAVMMGTASMPTGGTALFALLALGGDLGCSGGPTYVGLISAALGDDLRKGIFCAIIFPILLIVGLVLIRL